MTIEGALRRRIGDLIAASPHLFEGASGAAGTNLPIWAQREAWLSSALNAIHQLTPDLTSVHRKRADLAVLTGSTAQGDWRVDLVSAILAALVVDIDAGVVRKLADGVRAETFDDLLDQAEHYLRGKRKDPAGVLAGVVFEDTIRKARARYSLPDSDSLEQLIIALEKGGHLSSLEAKRARASSALRTEATHARWDRFSDHDVAETIRFARQLVSKLLG